MDGINNDLKYLNDPSGTREREEENGELRMWGDVVSLNLFFLPFAFPRPTLPWPAIRAKVPEISSPVGDWAAACNDGRSAVLVTALLSRIGHL